VSQLIEMAVRNQYVGPPGQRSTDGRESERTKVAREQGAYQPGSDPEAANLPKPRESAEGAPLPKIAKRKW
jgi:hypothetical protein